MIRVAVVMALLPPMAAAQEAPVAWNCLAEDGRAFRVELWQPSEAGVALHCVTGLDVGGVAGCAPQGGWGLSDPAKAPGELSGVAAKTAEAMPAEGKFFARVGLSEFVASASKGPGMPLALEVHGPTFWRMRMALATGEGTMFTWEGAVGFRCGGIEAGP
jgi:hypothetical protein